MFAASVIHSYYLNNVTQKASIWLAKCQTTVQTEFWVDSFLQAFYNFPQTKAKEKYFRKNLSLFVQHWVNQREHVHPCSAEYSALMIAVFII